MHIYIYTRRPTERKAVLLLNCEGRTHARDILIQLSCSRRVPVYTHAPSVPRPPTCQSTWGWPHVRRASVVTRTLTTSLVFIACEITLRRYENTLNLAVKVQL